jgi:uncharacterized membrane protein
MLFGAIGLSLVTLLPIAVLFYASRPHWDLGTRLGALSNFVLVTALWLVSVFLSTLKDYRAISGAFAGGMAVATVCVLGLAKPYGTAGLLLGFNLGLATIFFALVSRILAQYPFPLARPFAFVRNFKTYWMLAASGLAYNLAIWVDKWIMWFAPHAETSLSGMLSYPDYDAAMFLAQISIVPSIALFMMVVETRFYEIYLEYYGAIERHADFRTIARAHKTLIRTLVEGGRNILVLQVSLCAFAILMAPQIFQWFGLHFLQIGMFRLGVLGALFHVLSLLMGTLLTYFDFRLPTLAVSGVFLCTNALFTLVTLKLGFPYYGYGYFLGALCTFLLTYVLTTHYLKELPFQTFVGNNRALR